MKSLHLTRNPPGGFSFTHKLASRPAPVIQKREEAAAIAVVTALYASEVEPRV